MGRLQEHAPQPCLVSSKGKTERSAGELAAACNLSGNPASLSAIDSRRTASGRDSMAPKIRALFEATYDGAMSTRNVTCLH